MTNREKVIKDFETDIMNFTPACTSDELLKEIMETALELLKQDGCGNSAMAVEDRQMVVRCKDCKWWKDYKCENDSVLRQIYDCGCYPDFHTDFDWFCAAGERR